MPVVINHININRYWPSSLATRHHWAALTLWTQVQSTNIWGRCDTSDVPSRNEKASSRTLDLVQFRSTWRRMEWNQSHGRIFGSRTGWRDCRKHQETHRFWTHTVTLWTTLWQQRAQVQGPPSVKNCVGVGSVHWSRLLLHAKENEGKVTKFKVIFSPKASQSLSGK